jgi:hypothetical protein
MIFKNYKDDWRYTGQDKYLLNKEFEWRDFDGSIREHDHCEFCCSKFSEQSEDLHMGYCTKDKYHWICEQCYKDFKDTFHWVVIKN